MMSHSKNKLPNGKRLINIDIKSKYQEKSYKPIWELEAKRTKKQKPKFYRMCNSNNKVNTHHHMHKSSKNSEEIDKLRHQKGKKKQ